MKTIILQHLPRQHKSERQSLPWDQIVIACAEHLVTSADSDLWVSNFHDNVGGGGGSGSRGNDVMVVPVEWLHAQADTALLSAQTRGGVPPSGHTSTPARRKR